MSINRREALAVAAGCLLTARGAGGDELAQGRPGGLPPRPDPLVMSVPPAIRPVFEKTFPHHRCIRLVTRPIPGKPPTKGRDNRYYRATFFDPANTTVRTKGIGEEIVSTPLLYELEVSEDGEIMEETLRPVLDLSQLPKPVVAAYEKWNPKGTKAMTGPMWYTEVPREKDRYYLVSILVNSLISYGASFKEDGTVIAAEPKIVP